MEPVKILGREVAAWEALVFSVIALLGAFVFSLSVDQEGILNAAVAAAFGLIVAYVLKSDGMLAAVVGFAKALLAVALAFGLNMSPENQAVIMFAVANIAAFVIVRPNVVAPIGPSGEVR